MKMNFLRRLALLCAVLTCGMLLALPAAAAEADAPYAEDGDMDYIRSYVVTVDPREDGSVDITYDIDWQVIDGDKTDYLSWVKIGLANSSVDELTPLIYSTRATAAATPRSCSVTVTTRPMWPPPTAGRAVYILHSACTRAICSQKTMMVRQTSRLHPAGSTT